MNQDRELVDAIKAHFARKSSLQLQEIVQTCEPSRWSPEALRAAAEVLEDRAAGRAREPESAENEPQPIPSPSVPYSLGFFIGFLPVFALNGFRFGSEIIANDDSDRNVPVPFGSRMAWLAIDTTDTEEVTGALGLRAASNAAWLEGIEAASRTSVFITPPLGDWTLAVGATLFPQDQPEGFVKPLLERLSRRFGRAQYFCTHRDIELHSWARSKQGHLIRGYGWHGAKEVVLWDEGELTKEERRLGFQFPNRRSSGGAKIEGQIAGLPNENAVLQLAARWSIDPTTLDEYFGESGMGMLGKLS